MFPLTQPSLSLTLTSHFCLSCNFHSAFSWSCRKKAPQGSAFSSCFWGPVLFFEQATVQYTHRVVEIRVSSPPHPPKVQKIRQRESSSH